MAKCLGLLLDPRPALPVLKSLPASFCSILLCSAGFLALAANPLITQKSLLLRALFPARLHHKVLLLNTMGSTSLWLPSHSLQEILHAPHPGFQGPASPASSTTCPDWPWRFPSSFLCLCCSLPVLNPPTQRILIRTLMPRSNSPNVCPKKQVSSTGFPQPFDEASSMALSKHIILVILSVCLSVSLTLL